MDYVRYMNIFNRKKRKKEEEEEENNTDSNSLYLTAQTAFKNAIITLTKRNEKA